MRVSPRELQRFDAALARHGFAHRSDALRCMILAADDLLRPDDGMTEELRALSAARQEKVAIRGGAVAAGSAGA